MSLSYAFAHWRGGSGVALPFSLLLPHRIVDYVTTAAPGDVDVPQTLHISVRLDMVFCGGDLTHCHLHCGYYPLPRRCSPHYRRAGVRDLFTQKHRWLDGCLDHGDARRAMPPAGASVGVSFAFTARTHCTHAALHLRWFVLLPVLQMDSSGLLLTLPRATHSPAFFTHSIHVCVHTHAFVDPIPLSVPVICFACPSRLFFIYPLLPPRALHF